MVTKVENFKRQKEFDHFNICDNPFIIMTTKIDVTNLVEFCREHKYFYATMGFIITKTVNENEAFKYRYDENKNIYYCDQVNANFTDLMTEEEIGFFDVPFIDNYDEFMTNYHDIRKKFRDDLYFNDGYVLDVIWMSCSPWNTFNSLIPPFNKDISIPQFIWDKYHEENGRYYIDLMILINHGFADGLHIAKFIDSLNKNIENFNK